MSKSRETFSEYLERREKNRLIAQLVVALIIGLLKIAWFCFLVYLCIKFLFFIGVF